MNACKPTALAAATLIAIAAAGLAGCNRDNNAGKAPTPSATTPTTAPAPDTTTTTTTTTASTDANRTAGETIGDAAVTAKVKTAMLADPEVKGLQVNVDTVNGVVTLTGTVESQTQVDKAAAIASQADGVKSVNNNLTKRG